MAVISLSAIISLVFEIFFALEKEILLNANIFPSFFIFVTLVEILLAFIFPLFISLFPVTSRFSVSKLFVFSKFPLTVNLLPEAIVPLFFRFFTSIFSLTINFLVLFKFLVIKFLLVRILPLFVVFPLTFILSNALSSPVLVKTPLIVILLLLAIFPIFSSLDTVISLFALRFFSFLIFFEVKEPLVRIVPLFNTLFETVIFSTA